MNQFNEKLISVCGKYYPLLTFSQEQIVKNSSIRVIRKDDLISQAGKTDLNEYFLLEGIIHRYVQHENGDNISTGFYLPGSVLIPHFARTINSKSICNLQALTEVVLAEMPVKVLDSLRYSYDDIRSFGLKVVEQELLKSLAGEISHRSMSAADRLVAFRDNYPNLENLIPHTVIASFLGITPVSFSRLRKELAGK